ncbi:hypothetical protein [Thiolapillus brandeum]|uniref:hypothetical protein n=1 Tax=Thiolapillus brandeum TaxID=1076588 RepID=UPI0012B59DEA|nr:hypothetical protein [Thiolapillus brandeum]
MSNTTIKPLLPVWPVAAVIPTGKQEEKKPGTAPALKRDKHGSGRRPRGKGHIDTYA